MRNFREVMSGIDVQPLLDQLAAHPELWNSGTHMTAGRKLGYLTDEIELRFNRSSLPGLNDWNCPAFRILDAAVLIVFDVMRAIPGEHLLKVIISRLAPGNVIDWHEDVWPYQSPRYYQRYQIPLQADDGVLFHCGEETVQMVPGEVWWFNNALCHRVTNDSGRDRISMYCDIRPFVFEGD